VWKRQEACKKCLSGSLKRQKAGVGGREIYERILRKFGARMWDGFVWLRIGSTDEVLRMR